MACVCSVENAKTKQSNWLYFQFEAVVGTLSDSIFSEQLLLSESISFNFWIRVTTLIDSPVMCFGKIRVATLMFGSVAKDPLFTGRPEMLQMSSLRPVFTIVVDADLKPIKSASISGTCRSLTKPRYSDRIYWKGTEGNWWSSDRIYLIWGTECKWQSRGRIYMTLELWAIDGPAVGDARCPQWCI